MTLTARQLRQPPTIEAIERVPYFADIIFRKLYSVKQLLHIADFSKEVLCGSYLFNKVLAEELCL